VRLKKTPNLKALSGKIKKNIELREMVKAIYIVSLALFYKVQKRILFRELSLNVCSLFSDADETLEDYIAENDNLLIREKKTIIVSITSEKGCCGSINKGVINMIEAYFAMNSIVGQKTTIFSIGKKSYNGLKKKLRHKLNTIFLSLDKEVTSFFLIMILLNKLYKNICCTYIFIYNKFFNINENDLYLYMVGSFDIFYDSILSRPEKYNIASNLLINLDSDVALHYLYHSFVGSIVVNALLENTLSEFGTRVITMESAKENVTELVNLLKMEHNNARQEAITAEIAEIVAAVNYI
jgi:F-type H+-transporting ATPase subunit gamma